MSKQDKYIEERIQAYLDGRLSAEETDQLWADFLKEPELFEHLEMNANLKEFYRLQKEGKEPQAEIHDISEFQKYKKWIVALAAIILLTIMLNIFQTADHPLMISSIDQIDLLEMETVDVARNEAVFLEGADSLLFYAYNASVSDNFVEAYDLYDRVVARFPETLQAAKARLNKGILEYNKREYEEAISYFYASLEVGHDDMYVLEKTHWYLANSYINIEDYEQARLHAMEVYAFNGVYRNTAYQTLRQLNIKFGQEPEDGISR